MNFSLSSHNLLIARCNGTPRLKRLRLVRTWLWVPWMVPTLPFPSTHSCRSLSSQHLDPDPLQLLVQSPEDTYPRRCVPGAGFLPDYPSWEQLMQADHLEWSRRAVSVSVSTVTLARNWLEVWTRIGVPLSLHLQTSQHLPEGHSTQRLAGCPQQLELLLECDVLLLQTCDPIYEYYRLSNNWFQLSGSRQY